MAYTKVSKDMEDKAKTRVRMVRQTTMAILP